MSVSVDDESYVQVFDLIMIFLVVLVLVFKLLSLENLNNRVRRVWKNHETNLKSLGIWKN